MVAVVAVAGSEVAACELAALVEAVVSAEVDCEPAALVAVACVRPALTGVGLQEIASRMPVSGAELTSAGLEGQAGVGPATGPAGVGAVVADVGPAIAGAGVEITGAGVGAQPR